MSRAVKLVIHRTQAQAAPVPATPTAPEPDTELYRPMTGQEAAAWLGIDPTTLSQWTRGGDVPHVKLGAKPRYLKADLVQWMRERAA